MLRVRKSISLLPKRAQCEIGNQGMGKVTNAIVLRTGVSGQLE